MKKIEVELYEIHELSDKAKQKAIDWWKDGLLADQWQDWVIDEWRQILDKLGYPDAQIAYTGFWSQGDGCSFTVDNFHPTKRMLMLAGCDKDNYGKLMNLSFKIVRDRRSRYCHWNTVSVYLRDDYNERESNIEDDIEKLIGTIFEDHHNLSNHIYKALEEAYDYENSDENIIENISCNDLLFLKDGTIWRSNG